MTRFLLLHPPLLAPMAWRPTADVLTAAGHEVAVPDLRAACRPTADWWRRAVPESDRADVVVAHSGAGVLVPLAVVAAGATRAVFVDAVLPAAAGASLPGDAIRRFVAELPCEDGLLPPWSRWWPAEVLTGLVPDAVLRRHLEESEPRLPCDFYDVAVPVPPAWEPPRVSYLRLSAAYDGDAAEAERRGWWVRRVDGTHLDPLTRPREVADAILATVDP